MVRKVVRVLVMAIQTVHTTGINWESLAVILGGFAAVIAVLQTFTSRRQARLESSIADAVNHQTEILMAKLETKENVNELRIKMAEMQGQFQTQSLQLQSLLHREP